jgi:hypothetical protein
MGAYRRRYRIPVPLRGAAGDQHLRASRALPMMVSCEPRPEPIMSEPEQLTKLRRKLNAKTREIEALVASTHGLGDINDLDRTALRGLETEVETMIEEYENSLLAGDIIEEWRAQDARLAGTVIGQLLQTRHSIAEEIIDLQRDSNDYG